MYKLTLFAVLYMMALFGCDKGGSYENTTFVVTLEESKHSINSSYFYYKIKNVAAGAVKNQDDIITIKSKEDLFNVGDTVTFKKKGE